MLWWEPTFEVVMRFPVIETFVYPSSGDSVCRNMYIVQSLGRDYEGRNQRIESWAFPQRHIRTRDYLLSQCHCSGGWIFTAGVLVQFPHTSLWDLFPLPLTFFFLVPLAWRGTESAWYACHHLGTNPWWSMIMNVVQSMEWVAGEQKYSENTCTSASLFTTNPTWPDSGSNTDRRVRKPVTNRQRYSTALRFTLQPVYQNKCCRMAR
jgi:hypothetical protein